MAEYDAQLAREEAERKNRLTVDQQAEYWGTITGPTLPSNWEQRWRTKVGSSKADKDMAMAQLARRSKRDTILNLNTLNNAQIATQQEYRAGRIDHATYTLRMQQIETAKHNTQIAATKARIAEEGEAGQIQRNQSLVTQAEETAKWQKIRAENALREQQEATRNRNWRGDFLATDPARQMVDTMVVPQQDWPEYKRFDPLLRPDEAKKHINEGFLRGFINEKEKDEHLKHAGLADIASGKIGWPELDKRIKNAGYSRIQLGEELAKHMKNVAKSSDEFTADEQVVSSEAILEALLQLQNINPQKDWLSQYRQIKSDKTNFIRNVQGSQFGTGWMGDWGISDNNWQPLTSEEITLIMLMKESQKRQDPQYENDKKRFKDKFGWLPKWA